MKDKTVSKILRQKKCPGCGSFNVDRALISGLMRTLLRLTVWRRYECIRCGRKFYARKSIQ